MLVDFFQFLFNFIIAGSFLRILQIKLEEKGSPFANAVAFVH